MNNLILLKELIVSEGGERVNYGTYISYINKFTLARGVLLYRGKSTLMKKTIVFTLVMQLVIYLLIFLIA